MKFDKFVQKIGSNWSYLGSYVPPWLRIFTIGSYLCIFVLFLVLGGPIFAVAAIGGATIAAVGVLAVAFLSSFNRLYFWLSLLFAGALAFGLKTIGISDEFAGLGAIILTGWTIILCFLCGFKQSM